MLNWSFLFLKVYDSMKMYSLIDLSLGPLLLVKMDSSLDEKEGL